MSERLFSDDPIQNPREDKLGRGAFAKQIAEVCQNVAKESASSVVALVGAWGGGKSSILGLTEAELKKKGWAVAEFNPWLLSDLESLMRTFFSEIIEVIPTDTVGHTELRKKLGGYAKTISPLGKVAGLIGIDLSDALKQAGELIEGNQSLTKKRDELIKGLRKLKKPILVILDDIDRLHPDELLTVFKLVRLLGRLPNIHYLLSYDESTLLDVLMQTDLAKGDSVRARNYLEKIVQVKLDLPRLDSSQQLKLINLSLDEVLKRNSITLSEDDKKRLSQAYRDCLSLYLTQPRAIKRYFAQIEALYPLVQGEVNFADFTLLTFLRTFEPDVYRLIASYQTELTGQGFMTPDHDESNEDKKVRWNKLIEKQKAQHPEAIFDLLAQLFIPIGSARNNTSYANSTYKDERVQKRAGNKDYFDRYFIFGVPEGDIPDTELTQAVELLASDEKSAAKLIIRFIKKDADLTLRKLKDLQEKGSLPSSPSLRLLAQQYSSLPDAEGFFAMPPKWAAWDIVRRFIEGMTAKDRLTTFKELASNSSGLLLLVHTFSSSDKDKEKPIAKSLQEVLKKRVGQVMASIAKKKFANIEQRDVDFLYPYKTFFGDEELALWLWERVEHDGWDPITLLAKLVPESTAYGSDGARKLIGDLDSTSLDYFGLDRLLEYAEADIKKVVIKQGYSYREQNPTFSNKKAYVMRLLKNRYDNRSQDSEDGKK